MNLTRLTVALAAFGLMLTLNTPAEAVNCTSLDECMSLGQDAKTIDSALEYYSQGISLWKQGDAPSDLALATLIRAETYLGYFGESLDKKYLDLAETDFKQVTVLAPQQYNGFVGLALVAANRGQHDSSESLLKQAIAAEPQNPLSYFERARYYFIAENFPASIKDLTTAVGMLSQKTFDPATETYKVTPGADLPMSQRVMLYALRAQAHMKLGQLEEGHKDLDIICSLGEKSACRQPD